MIRFGLTLRPFDQQPLFGRRFAALGVVACRTHPPTSEPRAQRRIAAVAPLDLLPGIGGTMSWLRRVDASRRDVAACLADRGPFWAWVATLLRQAARPSWSPTLGDPQDFFVALGNEPAAYWA